MAVLCHGYVVEAPVEFRLLGPLEVAEDGRLVSLGGSRPRALLALLLLHRNEAVGIDRIVDELWPDQVPKSAEQIVRVYVSNLRKAIEPSRLDGPPSILVTRSSGYVLMVGPGKVDVDYFEELRAEGHRLLTAGDAESAETVLDHALSLWRGPPLQDFTYEAFARPEIARLEELRLATVEDRFDARLAVGHDSELVAELEQLVEANPLRERLRGQLMLALYRSDRQADALEAYQRGRRLVVDELGLVPSETLRRLETRILQQDPGLDRPSMSPHSTELPSRPPPHSRRPATLGIVATLVAIAAIAAALTAATVGHSHRPIAASGPVALVDAEPPRLGAASAVGVDPLYGLRLAAENLGVRYKVYYGGYQTSGFLRTIAKAARKSNFVIIGATPYVEAVSRLTRRFPKTRFLVPDSVFDPAASFAGQKNVTGLNFHDRENGYLGGYLAGLMTHGNQAVSAVGGKRTESVLALIRGFTQGARLARPGIRVLVNYSRTFEPGASCAALAKQQIRRGSEVVFDVAGACGVGALQTAGLLGVWGLGVDSDMSYLGPQILASVVKRFDRATLLAVTKLLSGQLPRGEDIRLDLASGNIGLVSISDQVPRAVRLKVDALEAKFLARDQARSR